MPRRSRFFRIALGKHTGGEKARDEVSWGVMLPSGQLVSRVGDGDAPGPSEDDDKGHVPPLAAESEKRNFLR
jgi:hypothetical protein